MSEAFLVAAIVGYLFSIFLAGLGIRPGSAAARPAASVLIVLTWGAHFAAVVQQGVATSGLPLSNMAEYLLVLGWAVMTLHLYIWFRLRVHVAGLVLPPIAAMAAFAAMQLLHAPHHEPTTPTGGWFLFHISVSTVGMAILGVAFAMSVIYLIQDRALKARKTLGLLQRLPALEQCDRIGLQALVIGFLLLSLGIGTGVVVNAFQQERLWVLSPKVVFPVAAWVIFATVLGARTVLGIRGKKSAYLIIAGFALGLLTVLGMTL